MVIEFGDWIDDGKQTTDKSYKSTCPQDNKSFKLPYEISITCFCDY
jgi:hypothetical protein